MHHVRRARRLVHLARLQERGDVADGPLGDVEGARAKLGVVRVATHDFAVKAGARLVVVHGEAHDHGHHLLERHALPPFDGERGGRVRLRFLAPRHVQVVQQAVLVLEACVERTDGRLGAARESSATPTSSQDFFSRRCAAASSMRCSVSSLRACCGGFTQASRISERWF